MKESSNCVCENLRRIPSAPIAISAAMLLLFAPAAGQAAFLRLLRNHGGSNITLQKRLHVNTLITEPGTLECDWSSVYSGSTSNFAMPSALKFTPQGRHIVWGRTEYSVAFDSLTVVDTGGGRLTQFSESVTVQANSVLRDGQKFDFAVAPQATMFLRDESGARLGAVAIARYDTGRNSMGATVSWSAATHSSPNNPAGTLDIGAGFGRQLPGDGELGKFTPHGNVVWEKSTGGALVTSAFEGVEYQMTPRVAFDLSGQHLSLAGGKPDHQVVFGLTVNFGKLH
jgi:hypothetical protein